MNAVDTLTRNIQRLQNEHNLARQQVTAFQQQQDRLRVLKSHESHLSQEIYYEKLRLLHETGKTIVKLEYTESYDPYYVNVEVKDGELDLSDRQYGTSTYHVKYDQFLEHKKNYLTVSKDTFYSDTCIDSFNQGVEFVSRTDRGRWWNLVNKKLDLAFSDDFTPFKHQLSAIGGKVTIVENEGYLPYSKIIIPPIHGAEERAKVENTIKLLS